MPQFLTHLVHQVVPNLGPWAKGIPLAGLLLLGWVVAEVFAR